jgi:hypothetical protein
MADRITVIAEVCAALREGFRDQAISLVKRDYPFAPESRVRRRYTPLESTRVFLRDGFIDRYTGERLIFPPVLRLISQELPFDFPYHRNWKADVTHPAYWKICATIDHIEPVSLGGADADLNRVTTSMAHNSAKLHWTLADLGLRLVPKGNVEEWDGLIHWFLAYLNSHPELITPSIRPWYRAATLAVVGLGQPLR